MRGGATPPHPCIIFFLLEYHTLLRRQGGNTGRLSFRPAVGQAVPAALVSPLTPFPGISAAVLNLMLIYQPQTAQVGIFLARRSAARLKNQAAGRGTIPLRARPARLILFLPSWSAPRPRPACPGLLRPKPVSAPAYTGSRRRFQTRSNPPRTAWL